MAAGSMTAEHLRISVNTMRRRMTALWARMLRLGGRAPRRLRLCESLPLGERRFVAVVEFDAARFLVGGTPSSLVLLSRLDDAGEVSREFPETFPKKLSRKNLSQSAAEADEKRKPC
jgi:flagellar biogenesis protein FliO